MAARRVGLGKGLDSLIPNRKTDSKSEKVDLSKEATINPESDDMQTDNHVEKATL